MSLLKKVNSDIASYHSGVVRNRDSNAEQIRQSLTEIGVEFAREIATLQSSPATVITPLGEPFETISLARGLTAVVSTKGDVTTFGRALADNLQPSILGYLNYEGRRALDALNTPIREIELPDPGRRTTETLLIAKAVLATGCTAISLTDTAVDFYRPSKLLIASIFHSLSGVQELQAKFPSATILTLGSSDSLDSEGILHPGVGLLEDRM